MAFPIFLDAIVSPSSYPCQSVGQWLIVSDLEIAIASPSFASLFCEMWVYLSAGGHERGDVAAWNTPIKSFEAEEGDDDDTEKRKANYQLN